jgi:hypothetical protein
MGEGGAMKRARTYEEAMHAMQSGVALDEARGSKSLQPKHLRVGINGALSDQGSLARLLIRKGLITEDEYMDAITEGANLEADSYEQRLSMELGRKVDLA